MKGSSGGAGGGFLVERVKQNVEREEMSVREWGFIKINSETVQRSRNLTV
jgi:hypothetical protein